MKKCLFELISKTENNRSYIIKGVPSICGKQAEEFNHRRIHTFLCPEHMAYVKSMLLPLEVEFPD